MTHRPSEDELAQGWKPDPTLYVLHLVREICRAAAAEHDMPEMASAATISAVERLARCDQRLAALHAELVPPKPKQRERASSTKRRS